MAGPLSVLLLFPSEGIQGTNFRIVRVGRQAIDAQGSTKLHSVWSFSQSHGLSPVSHGKVDVFVDSRSKEYHDSPTGEVARVAIQQIFENNVLRFGLCAVIWIEIIWKYEDTVSVWKDITKCEE